MPLVLSLVAAIGMYFGYQLHRSLAKDLVRINELSSLDVISDVQRMIHNNYFGPIDTSKYIDDVLSVITGALDEYSSYVNPSKSSAYNHVLNGDYRGYGFDFITSGDSIYVTKVLEGGPASNAGMERGDLILNSTESPLLSADGFLNEIISEDSILFRIYRPSTEKALSISLTKENIQQSFVDSKILVLSFE